MNQKPRVANIFRMDRKDKRKKWIKNFKDHEISKKVY